MTAGAGRGNKKNKKGTDLFLAVNKSVPLFSFSKR
jgi:hypothetical protein